jgi:hypothetical protein
MKRVMILAAFGIATGASSTRLDLAFRLNPH